MKLPVPGMPSDAMTNTSAKPGSAPMRPNRPPISRMFRVWMRS